jgi:hypothetical protein
MSQALGDWSLFLTFLFITVCVLLIIEYCAGKEYRRVLE